jgi:hypothetical protein
LKTLLIHWYSELVSMFAWIFWAFYTLILNVVFRCYTNVTILSKDLILISIIQKCVKNIQ